MSDFDDRARAAGKRARRDATGLAASTDPLSRIHASGSDERPHRARGWVLTVACVTVVAFGIGGLVVTRGDDNPATIDVTGTPSPAPSAPSGSATTTTGDPTVPGVVTEPTLPTATPPPSPPSEPTTLVRPIIDPAVCTPLTALDGRAVGLPGRPGSTGPLTLFAKPSELPVPIQVIGDPVDGQTKPFAMVLRYFDRPQLATVGDAVDIGGTDVTFRVFPNGNGEGSWDLPDGSQGYLRSRGLDEATITAIVASLTPRPADADVPGFDVDTSTLDGLEVVVDQRNDEPDDGEWVGRSQCRVASTGYSYRLSAVTGDDASSYGAVIDRPVPLDVGIIGDAVVIVSGPADPTAPTIDDVITADEETWRQLLVAPDPVEPERGQPIRGDQVVTVELVPVDDTSTPVSTLTLTIDEARGVAFLQVDTRDAVLAAAAEYWQTEVDGGTGGISSAGPVGSVMGFRIGDAPATEPFTVRVSTIDGDGLTIQTTGEIRLIPVAD